MKYYIEIMKLAWPIALGMLNNALMQFTDRAFLANESLSSLAAVLPANMLAFISLGFFQSIVAYSGVLVAQYEGAKDYKYVCLSYRAGIVLAVIFGLLVCLLIPAGNFLLSLINHSPEVLQKEITYYSIVSAGGIAVFGQMVAQSYSTGRGRTRIVFVVNLLGNLLNALLDPFLIFGWWIFPKLGIAGAAIATVLSSFIQWGILSVYVSRYEAKRVSWLKTKGEIKALVFKILRFGLPSGGYSMLDFLSFTIFVFVTGTVGDLAFAVSNACFSVNYLLFAPIQGFSLAAATLVGQAQGSGDSKAAYVAGNRTAILATIVISILVVLILAFYRPLLLLFVNDPANASEFLSLGFILFLMMGIWEIFDAADCVLVGALKGAGDTRFIFIWMTTVAFGIWIPLVLILSWCYNTMPALWSTYILEILVLLIGTLIRWRRGKWKSIKLTSNGGAES